MGTDPYRELFERSADAILIIEGETFVDCNQAAVDMLRYASRDEVLQTHPSQLSPATQPDGRESFEKANEMIAIAFEKGSHRFEWDHRRSDGEIFPVEVLLTAVQRGGKQILHVVWRDITDRRRLEGELRQSQKMQAVGQLAGGIAHDFNNLLVVILGYSQMLCENLEDPDRKTEANEIRLAATRAAALTRQLLTFSRKRPVLRMHVDLSEVLARLGSLLRRVMGENIQLVTVTPDAPMFVNADPSQLEQVALNLASNACDAMPDGGTVTMKVTDEAVDEGLAAGPHPLAAGRYVVLDVSDTGRGMDAATLRRAFEPFFTTKDLTRGTGLGLATVHGIAEQSGGAAMITSAPGQGTTVRVYFPLVKAPATAAPSTVTAAAAAAGTESILVVEDEAAVSSLVQRVLRRLGYEVLLARDGQEALSMWEQRGELGIDLILTDLVMPHMSGLQLVQQLRAQGREPRVLFMSGYAHDALPDIEADERSSFIEKPFSAAALADKIREVLDAPADGD